MTRTLLTVVRFSMGLALVLAAVATPALANTTPVPEIGVTEAGSAIALISGGYFILTSRFRK